MQLEIWQLLLGFIATLLSGAGIKNLAEFITRIMREKRVGAREEWDNEKDKFRFLETHYQKVIRDLRRELEEKRRKELNESLTEIDSDSKNLDS